MYQTDLVQESSELLLVVQSLYLGNTRRRQQNNVHLFDKCAKKKKKKKKIAEISLGGGGGRGPDPYPTATLGKGKGLEL